MSAAGCNVHKCGIRTLLSVRQFLRLTKVELFRGAMPGACPTGSVGRRQLDRHTMRGMVND